ncbi:protein NLRC5, partial [Etheostoma spectabile]|uniref:protein NLRC5 n=1 Tax=Etheostoma spectabile TaxID=54343 RepID=UPI0013AED816
MLKLWAQRDNEVLDYMFYFDMRQTSHIRTDTSLEDLLFSVFSEPDEGKEEVLQDIKLNSDNVTLIFDGVTDLSSSVLKRLVEKDLLPDAKLILTCRQDDEEEFASEDFFRVEVKGFSEQTIKTYLYAMLGKEQKVVTNVELLTLCHVPMYALMVAVCFSFETPEDSPQPCTITEIYINIVRFSLQMNNHNIKKRNLNPFINNKSKEILSLAEAAFHATEGKTVNLTERPCEDSCVLCFLKALFIDVAHTETKATYAFLHYTMQEFFAALWLLKNPEKIKDVFQQCLTEEKKHMKHLIPFMCGLLNEKSPSLMNCLIPAQELKNTSNWFFKELMTTFFNSELEEDILFFCQCLYESQCPEACVHLLDKLGCHLDLSGETLDPYPCCAVAYVVTQSKRKISLNLEDVTVSEQGMTRLFGCLENVQWCDPLPQHLGEIFLLSEGQRTDELTWALMEIGCNLPVGSAPAVWTINLSERKSSILLEVLKLQSEKKPVELTGCSDEESEVRSFLQCLPYISQLRSESPSIITSVFQSAPAVWTINLSERKSSILLEVLKLQSEKKPVELTGCSDEESEVRSFLQCLPYISQLSVHRWSDRSEGVRFFVNLFCAAEREQLTGEKTLELLSSVCRYETFPIRDRGYDYYDEDDDTINEYQSDFLLDLYSHLKNYETESGLSLLPSLQSVFQSAPAVWTINLSERKSSILLEVLKLQSEKKPVELTACSDEESEVRSFLQCLPYISQLSGDPEFFQRACSLISVRSGEEAEQFVSLLQLLGFSLLLTGELRRKTCRSVGTVVRLCGSDVNLILTPRKMSARGASLLFRRTTQLHSLKLSIDMALFMCRWVRRGTAACRLTIAELSLSSQTAQPSERVLLKVVSSLASLLRYWTVSRLDLTESCVPAQGLIPLLLHEGPLTIKLSEKVLQPLLSLLHEIQ